MTEYETSQPADIVHAAQAPVSPSRVFEKLAVVMVVDDPGWSRVEAILRPHLRNGQMSVSLWPVSGETEAALSQDLIATLGALFGLVWADAIDSALILGNRLFPIGPGPFLDAGVRDHLQTFPAPVLIAGPSPDEPTFGTAGWDGLRTPEAMAAAVAATVARYPTILERAANNKNK